MMNQKISKTGAKEQIDEFFKHLRHKNAEDVKKMKKLAMKYNIKLGDKRKLFCKKCLNPHNNSEIMIKNGFLNLTCDKCGFKNRWKMTGEFNFGICYNEHENGCC